MGYPEKKKAGPQVAFFFIYTCQSRDRSRPADSLMNLINYNIIISINLTNLINLIDLSICFSKK